MIDDKLSRIAALRPASSVIGGRIASPGGSPAGTRRLLEILDAKCRSNGFGEHISVRRKFPEPRICQVTPQAMRLLAPEAASEISDPHRWLFLDTETTGLAGGTGTYAFLVGIAWWEDEGFVVEQFFMRNHAEEASLLAELSGVLAQRRPLVTFNGKSFDWPLLETRYRMCRIGPAACPSVHLDFLHPARQLYRLKLKSVGLAELEKHILSIERGYDIPSESIPGRYFDFLRGGPAEPIAEVFHHNQMDLRGLAALAVHITSLLRQPESAECESAELYGISRLLQRRGENDVACITYQRALSGGLPAVAWRTAKRQLALNAKRQGRFDRANRLWEELAEDEKAGPEAREHLAIYYEHEARDLPRAASLTRQALIILHDAACAGRISSHTYRQWHARFQHRLTRLESKLKKSE